MARKKEPERIEINQEKIAKKAKELFKRNGIEATKMEEIAKAVDMSKTTLYVYFKNKEEIRNYLFLKAIDALYQELYIVNKYRKDILHDRFLQMCDVLVEMKKAYPDEFDILVQKIAVNSKEVAENPILQEIYEKGESINQMLYTLFEDVLEKNADGLRIIFSQWGCIYGIITLAFNKEEYLIQEMKMTKEEFLSISFENLYSCFSRAL